MSDPWPPLTEEQLAAIEARLAAVNQVDPTAITLQTAEWQAVADFQTAAPTDIARLVAEVRRLRALLAEGPGDAS